jgi:AraC-like DNA-binding protein
VDDGLSTRNWSDKNMETGTAACGSAAGMHALTREGWRGLPLARWENAQRDQHLDVDLQLPLLALHEEGSGDIGVRRHPFAWNFSFAPGRFDFYPAGHYDAIQYSAGRMKTLVLTVPDAFERLVLQERGHGYPLPPGFQFQDRRLERMVQALAESASSPARGDEVEISLAIVDRLHEVIAPAQRKDASGGFSPLMRRLIAEHVDRHLGRPVDVDVESFARLTGLARTQFSEAFRESFGQPLRRYVLQRRIEVAKQQLRGAQRSLTEVAHELGFASHAHFTTVFKSRVGVTPTQFREAQSA